MKYAIIALLALAATGCATKGDVSALQIQIDGVKADVAVLKTDVEALKANDEALKGDLADLNGKLDRLFVKQALK